MSEATESRSSSSLTEQDFSLLSQASDEFNKQRFSNCLQTLSQYEQSAGSNTKIQHNKAVVAFYAGGCKDYETLMKFLDQDIVQLEKNPNDNTGRNTVLSYYNKATILFHLRKPFAAINLLDPLLKKIDELDDSLKSKVGLLLITLLLSTNQYQRAYDTWTTLVKHVNASGDLFGSDEQFASNSTDINSFGRMFKLVSMLTEILNEKVMTIPDDGSVEYTFLRSHKFYLGKDFQMAAKQLTKQFTCPRFSVGTHGEDQDVCLANNMGVIHLRVRHYAIAAQFFQHALKFDNKITENGSESSILNIGASKKPEIMYNLGMSMLHLQKPKEAFECFLIPLKVYQNNPRIWLRTAEACIMFYEKEIKMKEGKHIVSDIIGSGIFRKFLITPTPKISCPEDGQTFAIPNPNLEFAALCLRNAISLAENQMSLFPTDIVDSSSESPSVDPSLQIRKDICNPSPPITRQSFNRLLAAIYTAYSYVCIRLGDFTIALEYAKKLLEMKSISDEISMLGHLYCAEALIMLNRVAEARTYLDQNFISNLNSQDFETIDWQINSIDAAKSVLRYNLAVTLVLQGDFTTARNVLAACTHPVVFTKYKLLKMYMELLVGNIEHCRILIKFDTPQYR